jgi:hypothetical protein
MNLKARQSNTSRRDFLKTASAATLAALAAGAPKALAGDLARAIAPAVAPKADSVILLWMGGAVCQTDTFDPKKYTPFEKGMETKSLLSTFKTADTVVDQIKFAEGLPQLASVMDRGALVRSYVAREYGATGEDLQHIPFQYKWHTGYNTPSTVPAPYLGATISKVLGPRNPDLPAYIEIGRSDKTANVFLALSAFNAAGFLGAEHGPLFIPEPMRAAEVVGARLKSDRFANRYKRYREAVEASPVAELASSYQKESMMQAMDNAYRLVQSPSVKAFDLTLEPKEAMDAYNTGPFGRGCLLARRVVEAGGRFVEVHVDFENAKGWDTHSDGHNGVAAMKNVIDRPVARLIRDLETRGLLDRTLVVLATEFGRSVVGRGSTKSKTIEKMDQYGMHGHFASAASILFWGAGVKKGALYGKTNDLFPCEAVENPVGISDLHATIFQILGIKPSHGFEIEKRPFYVTKDGLGKPIPQLLA